MKKQELNQQKTHLRKFKSAVKNKIRTTLRITEKNFQDEELSLQLFLTKRQKIK